MNTLLHVCCAPCSISCIDDLREEGISPVGYWYNPNIHPLMEYRQRRDALIGYAQAVDMPLEIQDEYGLNEFIMSVYPNFKNRCDTCYSTRLYATAKHAANIGADSFTTTLLISPYQNHSSLQRIGDLAGKEFGVKFLYRDFRPLFRTSQQKARELALYMQKYCGCIFSEEERYSQNKKKPQAPNNL